MALVQNSSAPKSIPFEMFATEEKRNHGVAPDAEYKLKASQHMIASCGGALITSLMVTPFDVVKVRLQAQQRGLASNKCCLYYNGLMDHVCPCAVGQSTKFAGTFDAFSKIARCEGVSALWSGLSPTLVLALPATVVYFVSYERLRLHLKERHGAGGQPPWVPLVAGATARTFAVTLVSPLELIRTKMQAQRISFLELGEAVRILVQHQGPRGLYKGLGPTLLRDVPFSAIYWTCYEALKGRFMTSTTSPSFSVSFLSGAAAGSVAAFVTTPFDVVKTHQQIELGEKVIFTETPSGRSSMRATFQRILARHGVAGLFAGLAPRLLKVAPACAIMISSFELGKQFFHKRNEASRASTSTPVN